VTLTTTMRVLFSCRPAFGHYAPLVPLASALVRSGHEVCFATGAPLDDAIRRDGFEVERAGLSLSAITAARERDPRFAPAQGNPRLARPLNFAWSFAGFEVPPRASDLLRIVHQSRPDLIVHETSEFAGPLVARLAGLSAVNHSYGPLVEPEVMAAAGLSAAEHWAAHGLLPAEHGGMYGRLYLDITPPSIQFEGIAAVPRVQPMRPEPYQARTPEPASWLLELGRRPVVAVTLGTVHGRRLDVYRTVIAGLATGEFDVVVATGSPTVTASLGRLPGNVQAHDWVPWGDLLERADAVVAHGGAGSTLAALCLGVPMVVIPLGSDHFTNARMLESSGAAVVLDCDLLTAERVSEAVAVAMGEAARSAAQQIATEIEAMPSPDAVVPGLVALA
jgi:UDP:flavonoid glycosyltransferase YjiC (YdhE family)